ncbi:MAG: hypothetical protein RR356_02510 [Bacteroidales bacterium]
MKNLEELKEKNYFHVPEGFFEQLPNDILNTIKKEEKKNRLYRKAIVAAAIAAIVVIGSVTILFFPTPETAVSVAISNSPKIESFVENPPPTNTPQVYEEELDNIDYQIMEYYNEEVLNSDYLY